MRRAGELAVGGLVLAAACLLASCGAHRAGGAASASVPGPWEHAFVELADRVDGEPLRMHYLAAGPVDGPRVVLVHGFPDFSYTWRRVLPGLAEEYRVVAPDLRGFGATDRPESGYGVHDLAADLAAFIGASAEADGLPPDTPVHLIAHDWGAMTSWWMLIDELVPSLTSYTALSVPHPLAWQRFLEEDDEQRRRAVYQRQLSRPGVAGLLGGLSRRPFDRVYRGDLVHPERVTDAELDVYWQVFAGRDDWGPPLRYYQQARADAESLSRDLAEAAPIPVPVLVVWGQDDGFLYARQAPMSCEHVAPGPCEVEVLEETGHFIQWDNPEQLVQRWRRFVAGLAPADASPR